MQIAVDIGGTYVDAVMVTDDGRLISNKNATTPADPVQGVMSALEGLTSDFSNTQMFVHGTTLGLNAILQRKGATVGLITNLGFEDILEVGRAAVPDRFMYDFFYAPPSPLVPRKHRVGVPGRVNAEGDELTPLDLESVIEAGRYLVDKCELTSIAICFLHSYRNSEHEQKAKKALTDAFPNVSISASTDLSSEYGEYERTMTAVLDAYISPILGDYLERLERGLADRGFKGKIQIMRSGGGAMELAIAKKAPLLTVLSGPAGGIAGAKRLTETQGWNKIITFDVGGTSLDCCVILDSEPVEVHEAYIDDLPMQIPVFDIRTIGAGGGSIAKVVDGILQVGPDSAGAVPGPVCYGAGGDQPTITDASIVLGYLDPDNFLGGKVKTFPQLSHEAIKKSIAEPLGISTTQSAVRILEILMAKTVGAVKQITIERGLDPHEFKLVAFGGAGPLIGPLVGREIGIESVVIPALPGTFSAVGMLMTDLEYEFSVTVLKPLGDGFRSELEPLIQSMKLKAEYVFEQQSVSEKDRIIVTKFDLRYRGQEHHLSVDVNDQDTVLSVVERFQSIHKERYGHSMDEPCEVASVRIKCFAKIQKPDFPRIAEQNGSPRPYGNREAFDFALGDLTNFMLYDRGNLGFGAEMVGPLIVQESAAATVVFSDQEVRVDEIGQLIVTRIMK